MGACQERECIRVVARGSYEPDKPNKLQTRGRRFKKKSVPFWARASPGDALRADIATQLKNGAPSSTASTSDSKGAGQCRAQAQAVRPATRADQKTILSNTIAKKARIWDCQLSGIFAASLICSELRPATETRAESLGDQCWLDRELGNVELLCETTPKVQCSQCLLYWNQGIVYCTCGQCLIYSESRRKFNKLRLDAISIPDYVIKKGATHGAQGEHFKGIHDRVYRESHNSKSGTNMRKKTILINSL